MDDESYNDFYNDDAWFRSFEGRIADRIQKLEAAGPPTETTAFLQQSLTDTKNERNRRTALLNRHEERAVKEQLQKLRDGVKFMFDSDFSIRDDQVIAISRQAILKDLFFALLNEQSSKIKKVHFNFVGVKIVDPAAVEQFQSMDLVSTTTAIGQTIGSFPALETIVVVLKGSAGPHMEFTLTRVVLGCRQVKRLVMQPISGAPEAFAIFSNYIQYHANLEVVEIVDIDGNVQDTAFDSLVRPLAFLRKLTTLTIDFQDLFEFDSKNAEVLRSVLEVETLTKATLNNFGTDEDEEATDIICAALENSNLTHLTATNWCFAESKCAALAQALTSSKLIELSFSYWGPNILEFYNALGLGLAAPASRLQILHFEYVWVHAECATALLQHAPLWRLQCFHLKIGSFDWTEEFTAALTLYVATTKYLHRLVLHCATFARDNLMVPAPFLVAVGSGNGRLDELEIVDDAGKPVSENWALLLKKHCLSNLNRHRRRAGHMFDAAMWAETAGIRGAALVKGLCTVDASARFAFLSRDECRCRRTLLEELKHAVVP
ncbi:hypothetical protein MPSEU_000528200 [Mayamaea pseudoterrestris]|nr:hypothetical protein MPSEU_000528200 [Mayamaea pseudoterrestris]